MLTEAGHDVTTVLEQNLTSAPDPEVISACQVEQCCLVTLDLDFSNPLRFQPSQDSGIAVMHLPNQTAHQDLLNAIQTLIAALEKDDITGKLWIVQRGTIRIYQEES